MKRLQTYALLLPALLVVFFCAAAAAAQDASRLESDAKKAFDSGRFAVAGEKYAAAAESPGVATDKGADLHLQSAWAYFIGGNSKAARENLKAAFTARPNLDIVADFYSPDFVRMAQVLFRPAKVYHKCPDCGLSRHDADAVHCKDCGRLLNIENEGEG